MNVKYYNHSKCKSIKAKQLLWIFFFAFFLFDAAYAQDAGQTGNNKSTFSNNPGKTKFLLTGAAWFGGYTTLGNSAETDVTTNFNSYGFSPVFLWKLSDKMFFESEIEINNGEFELEFAKLSYMINNYMTIGAGRMLTPFGAYGERWEPKFVERFPNSPITPSEDYLPGAGDTHLNWGAMMGVDLRGGIPLGSAKLNYAVYVSNGPALDTSNGLVDYENLDDNNNNKEIGGRIGILPFANSSLEIGLSARHGKAGDQGDPTYKDVAATAYAVDWNYVKAISALSSTITFRGQWNNLMVDNATYGGNTFDNKLNNYFVQFSIRPSMVENNVLKNVELLARYNVLAAPPDAPWGAKDTNGNGGNISRTDIGLDYWFSWRTGLRMAYEATSMPDGTNPKELLASLVYGF